MHYNSDVLAAALALAQAGVPRRGPGMGRALLAPARVAGIALPG